MLEAGPSELAGVVLEPEHGREHHEEAEERRPEPDRDERVHEDADAHHERERGVLDLTEGVTVEAGRTHGPRQRGVGLVELLLDLMEDALFVLGKRHLTVPVVLDAPCAQSLAHDLEGNNASRALSLTGL